ncbi:uncharacterized protein LOC133907548 [Phragmites australis]|uniref:uncharacterized protein LOC133907548 n=1 Tax=Phragmites australis TaxID=29695 RepID=UPI002D78A682|nr:uncharacterized protein LOC133907548 [Phragmites australis]
MAPFHVPLLLIVPLILPLAPLLSAAAASHQTSPASTHAHLHHHGHHHRSPMMTATARINTAPSMHQNHLESEEGQSLLVLDPFTFVAAQAPSGEEAMAAMGAAASAADPTLLDSPQAPSPPPSFIAAPDLASLAQPQPQPQAESEEAAPPPVDEPAAGTTTLPLPTPYSAAAMSPPLPIHASAAGLVASGDYLGLQQLARVLTSLGYNEMASAAALLDDSPSVARWPGAITVFAAPDVFLQASCPGCSRHHLLLEHIALGYFPYSELAAAPTVKLPSASVGFCLNVASEKGPFAIHHASLYVDGVEVSHPELYNDGRYVVHGLHGFLPPLSHTCFEGSHHHHRRHHLTAKSAATSAATAASVVRIMIREAISRLRDGGFGFVSLAMRVKFTELEKFANLTVFALDDQAIFTGGGHDYVSSVRFHIVPGYRLSRADLLRLRPGTILPTMAGEDQKLVITHGAGSASNEVLINYVPLKEPNVVINSRVAVHGIYVPFPRLHFANLAASVAVASTIQVNGTCGVGGPFGDCASSAMTSATIPDAQGYGEGQ